MSQARRLGRVEGSGAVGALLVPAVFLFLGGIFLLDPLPYSSPIPTPTRVPPSATDTTPVRTPVLRPEATIAVYTYRCSECHSLIPSPRETERPLTQHRHIRLEHGINDRCFNCHHREDRNSFVDDRGATIPYSQPQILCAKCHGPVYRDWTHGVHGRTNGFWDASKGPLDRRKCVECHDPHAPAFAPLRPAPGPQTLRMGDQGEGEPHGEVRRNPLLIYRQGGAGGTPHRGDLVEPAP